MLLHTEDTTNHTGKMYQRRIRFVIFLPVSRTRQKSRFHFSSMSSRLFALSVMSSAGFRSRRHRICLDTRRRLPGCSCHQGWTHICGRFRPRKWLQKWRDISDNFITLLLFGINDPEFHEGWVPNKCTLSTHDYRHVLMQGVLGRGWY